MPAPTMTALALVLDDEAAVSAGAGEFSAGAGGVIPLIDSLMGTILVGPDALRRFGSALAVPRRLRPPAARGDGGVLSWLVRAQQASLPAARAGGPLPDDAGEALGHSSPDRSENGLGLANLVDRMGQSLGRKSAIVLRRSPIR